MEEATEMQKQDQEHEKEEENWSEHVENLLETGDVEGAISFLESVVSSFSSTNDAQLVAAMSDLADLYSSRGFSMKSDELKSCALSIRARLEEDLPTQILSSNLRELKVTNIDGEKEEITETITSNEDIENEEDDWEVIADQLETRPKVLSLDPEIEIIKLNDDLEGKEKGKSKTRRKGRGSFLYNKSILYSEIHDLEKLHDNDDDVDKDQKGENRVDFGTRHVLVLYDFPTSTRTIELEKIFQAFNDRGVAIRWVNDTCALAVFRTSSLAKEAKNEVPARCKVRFLRDDDEILTQIKPRDLEPPLLRPKTSASTAQRLIAQGMGLHIKSCSDYKMNEHKSQERERKNRIVSRQALRDDAWGPD